MAEKSAIIYDFNPDELGFYLLDGDLRQLNGIYVGSAVGTDEQQDAVAEINRSKELMKINEWEDKIKEAIAAGDEVHFVHVGWLLQEIDVL